jgi:predicted transcriptional regulator
MRTDLRFAHYSEIAETLTGKRAFVHAAMAICAPCTATELAEKIGWDKCSCRPRMTELFQAGLLEVGERRNSEYVYFFVSVEEAERRWKIEDQRTYEMQFSARGDSP